MIVGTALNHVQRCALTQSQNLETRNRDGITTEEPLRSGAITVTTWPLM